MKLPLSILHLEDDDNDAELIFAELQNEGIASKTTRAKSRKAFETAIGRQSFDLVLADFSVPGFDGLCALATAREKWPDVPFILVSGTLGEEKAIESMKRGATDYVLKTRLSRLVPAVRRAMAEVETRLEKRRAEQEREVYARKLQMLSRRLVEAQETERRRIARELHDEVGQSLTVMLLNLQGLSKSLASSSHAARVQETISVVEHVLEQVRNMSLDLRPPMLDDLGLEAALRWYVRRNAELAGLEAVVELDTAEQRFDSVVETECFRIAQEALTNVTRHANAKSVRVELAADESKLHLWIRDDGKGFDVPAMKDRTLRGSSLGLMSMEERALLAGGGLELNSSLGRGTEVHAWFPLTSRAASA